MNITGRTYAWASVAIVALTLHSTPAEAGPLRFVKNGWNHVASSFEKAKVLSKASLGLYGAKATIVLKPREMIARDGSRTLVEKTIAIEGHEAFTDLIRTTTRRRGAAPTVDVKYAGNIHRITQDIRHRWNSLPAALAPLDAKEAALTGVDALRLRVERMKNTDFDEVAHSGTPKGIHSFHQGGIEFIAAVNLFADHVAKHPEALKDPAVLALGNSLRKLAWRADREMLEHTFAPGRERGDKGLPGESFMRDAKRAQGVIESYRDIGAYAGWVNQQRVAEGERLSKGPLAGRAP